MTRNTYLILLRSIKLNSVTYVTNTRPFQASMIQHVVQSFLTPLQNLYDSFTKTRQALFLPFRPVKGQCVLGAFKKSIPFLRTDGIHCTGHAEAIRRNSCSLHQISLIHFLKWFQREVDVYARKNPDAFGRIRDMDIKRMPAGVYEVPSVSKCEWEGMSLKGQ